MGKVNIWVKWSYMGVIAVIGAICILLLGFTLFSHGVLHSLEKAEGEIIGLHFSYIFSAVILLFALFGGFGAWKEKKWALIVFAVGMILSSLFLLVLIISALAVNKQMVNEIKKELSFLPLANASESHLLYLNNLQKESQCCGLESYKDWEDNIPESCRCTQQSTNPCLNVDVPSDSSQLWTHPQGQPSRIYAKPCLPVIIDFLSHTVQVILGIMWGIILLWVLSIGLCVAILCQMNKKLDTPKVAYSSAAKGENYITLTECLDADEA